MAGNHYALGQPMMPAAGRQLGGVPSLEDVRRVLSRSDKARPSSVDAEGLLVNACGRTVNVPEGTGVTLLLHHVQKALQDELGLPNQTFDITDRNGARLLTDQDLRDTVMSGKIPLNAKLTDTSAKIQSIQSDIKWVCQQVGILRGQLESQSKEHSIEIESLRNEMYSVIETAKERTQVDPLKGDGLKFDLINADSGIQLASMEQFQNLENDIRHLGAKYEELSSYFRSVMSEYSRHHDRSSTQTSDAITRLVDRCAGLDARITNAELGVRGGMSAMNRDAQSPQAPSAFPRGGGLGSNSGSLERKPGGMPQRMGPAASQSPQRAVFGGGSTPSNRSTRSTSPRFPEAPSPAPPPSAPGSSAASRALTPGGSVTSPPSIPESPSNVFRQRSQPPAPPGPLQLSSVKQTSGQQPPGGRGQGGHHQGSPVGSHGSVSGTQLGKVIGSNS